MSLSLLSRTWLLHHAIRNLDFDCLARMDLTLAISLNDHPHEACRFDCNPLAWQHWQLAPQNARFTPNLGDDFKY